MLIKPQQIKMRNGFTVEIRSASVLDVEEIANHRKITSAETYYMARYPEECVFDMETMRSMLKYTENSPSDFMVTAFMNGKIVGDLGVTMLRPHIKYRHRAYMGISIQKEFCNCGLGSIMTEIAIEQARKNGFEQLELGVFADNDRAIHLYEKYGFKKYGIQPNAFKLKDGTYRDEIIMVNMLQ